jgi:phage gp29-like protein
MSALVQFYNRITNLFGTKSASFDRVSRGGSGITEGRTGFDPMKDAVSWDDFPELATTFFNYFPDPDEVLLKLGQNSGIYREMLTDSHIGGCLLQRKAKTKQRSIEFIPGDASPRAEDARALCERQIRAIPRLRNVVSEILNSPFYGASYLELYYDRLPPEEGKRPAGEVILKDIKEKPFEWFAWDKDGTLGIKDQLSATFSIRPVPSWKFVAIVYDGSYANPYGDRACKRVYWPWLFKKGGFRFWAEFIEKYGMPFLHGQLDPKKSDEDVAAFHEILYNMVRNGIVVTKSEGSADKISVIETSGRQSSADAYLRYKNALNIEISKAILGETLTIENSESGSQAATETHKEALNEIQEEDRATVESALSEICRRVTAYNFPPEVAAPKVLLVDKKELNKAASERDAILAEKIGVRFKENYISRVYSIPEGDFEIREPVSPSAAFPGAQAGAGAGEEGGDRSTNGPARDRGFKRASGEPGAGEEGESEEGEGKDAANFADKADFEIQVGIDQYVQGVVSNIEGLTAPIRAEIFAAIKTAKSYDEMIEKIVPIKDRVNQEKFVEVFGAALNTVSILGLYAAERGRI